MEMTLKDAYDCINPNLHACRTCKYNKQEEIDCRGTALSIGAKAIKKLMEETEKNDMSI